MSSNSLHSDNTNEEEDVSLSVDSNNEEDDYSYRLLHLLTFFHAASAAACYYVMYHNKVPSHTRKFSGWANLIDMLNCEIDRRCYENFRMEKHVFFMLCKTLVDEYGLRAMRGITVEEQVATFLMTVGIREGNRQLQEFFQRSSFTISKSFHRVLKACNKMAGDLIHPVENDSAVHPYIRNNSKYDPYFKDCIGAMDGTHIPARLPAHEQIPYIGRKGVPTQNVLAICDFDLCFTYVVAGWEGTAHDTRVFLDAFNDPGKRFPKPPGGKYYLVDTGYPNAKGFLAPYKGEKYHLPDFRRATHYNNDREIFNHAHSSLRSSIERTFGIWKSKFHILKDMPVNYKFQDQVAIVVATMAIHNFIRRKHFEDEDFRRFESATDDTDAYSGCVHDQGEYYSRNDFEMDAVRNNICSMINARTTRLDPPVNFE